MSDSTKKKGLFSWYFNANLLLRILIGLILGAVVGIIVGPSIAVVQPLGSILVNLLKMIVMPLVLTSLIVGAASILPKELGKIGVRIFVYYMLTSALAVSIGLIVANVFHPGAGLELAVTADAAGKILKQPKFIDTLIAIIPKNPFGALSQGQVLPTIFFALVFGIGIAVIKNSEDERLAKSGNILFSVFDGAAEVMYIIVRWILEYAPIGVFALIAVVFGKQGASAFGSLGLVTLTAYVGFVLQIAGVYGVFLIINKLSYFKFFKGAREAMITAFVTRSSSGTLPVTMRNMNENLGVPKKISSFTLPLGATINMDGTAIYMGVCALFITNAIGMDLNITQQLTIILTAVLASIGSAGIPGAGAIMLLMVLNSIGITIEAGSAVAAAYAMILGIDALLDMGRTITNVTGDMVGTILVSKGEKELDMSKWGK
ncbi:MULTISPECIES: dicarboxylate/amino acid:cation symporter [unclassified Oceanispirochaeta]|uniref:dicarboxylate/amino acid:cation symporter n=1 Tax=unclassified Oceanispirochaeta TaxID=2635722 RepID=UPI000E0924C3|nr:dicarboxylate/amino acid:cation symporter [Oceanispirochaeta sp. M1]MBF9016642.1 dicarboxylate/amino acid:cation symporter [Oceanispirochaeta sp. M2]NPD73153.1 dicarboxylate/amino acid:cation symporter [Oceanispirochaeta sp. M1]RDG31251.1 dicarboxylate/amino acid:cation symporter [Oceanispirochaeta sp. M1]